MAFQAAPVYDISGSLTQQNFAQEIVSHGTTPAAGTWQAAPLPSNVNQQTVGYPIN